MRGRFLLVFVVIYGLFLGACAKTQVVGDDRPEIVMDRLQTKADYPEGGVFGIYAYHLPVPSGSARLESWKPDVATAYLQNAAFRYEDSEAAGYDTANKTHKPYYWPLSGSLVFAGYSPHVDESSAVTAVSLSDNISVGRPENPHIIIDFTQNAVPGEMVDLLYFTMMPKSVSKEDSPVSIAFSRAMSKVSISFKDPNGYYRIRNVRLKDCINQGKFYAAVESSGWSPVLSGLSDYVLQEGILQLGDTEAEMPDVLPLPQFLDGFYSTLGAGRVRVEAPSARPLHCAVGRPSAMLKLSPPSSYRPVISTFPLPPAAVTEVIFFPDRLLMVNEMAEHACFRSNLIFPGFDPGT